MHPRTGHSQTGPVHPPPLSAPTHTLASWSPSSAQRALFLSSERQALGFPLSPVPTLSTPLRFLSLPFSSTSDVPSSGFLSVFLKDGILCSCLTVLPHPPPAESVTSGAGVASRGPGAQQWAQPQALLSQRSQSGALEEEMAQRPSPSPPSTDPSTHT